MNDTLTVKQLRESLALLAADATAAITATKSLERMDWVGKPFWNQNHRAQLRTRNA